MDSMNWSWIGLVGLGAFHGANPAGVGLLRRAWFNLDLLWAAALLATSIATLTVG